MELEEIKELFKSIGFTDDTKGTDANTFACGSFDQMGNNRNSKGWVRAQFILLEDEILDTDSLRRKWRDQGWVKDVDGKTVAPYAPQYLIFKKGGNIAIWDSYGEEKQIRTSDDLKKIIGLLFFLPTEINSQQIIFYGAPGTGKSKSIKKITGEEINENLPNVFRTIFHPDTDYATFVGCYKPVTKYGEGVLHDHGLSEDELLDLFYKSNRIDGEQKARYMYEGLINAKDISRLKLNPSSIAEKLSAKGFKTTAYKTELSAVLSMAEWLDKEREISDDKIVYDFVPQAFTDAYVYAFKHPFEKTFLVIEEINRGNCAQIFGDLFQLLDRKSDGTSEYQIKPDKDLAKYLAEKLYNDNTKTDEIKLCLPGNMYILATMNTSDQSLFPMDSAFKRRWDWEYIPISYDEPKSVTFTINIGEKKYSWVSFIKNVNERIFDLTQSEDKQLGNFFIKCSVDERQFKSKVMFYLWNEILRDEVENGKYFFFSKDDNDNNIKFTFRRLYENDSANMLEGFMKYLGIECIKG